MARKEKILLVLVAGIGDMILSSRSMRAIRNAHPDSEIHLLTNKDAFPLAINYPYLDKVWPFPIREVKKNKKHLPEIMRILKLLRKERFDTVANLYKVRSRGGALNMGVLFSAIGGHNKIGHDAFGFGKFLNETVPQNTFDNRHVAEAIMDIAHLIGCKEDHGKIELFWSDDSEKTASWVFEEKAIASKKVLVGINPGGNRESHRWSCAKFSEAADFIAMNENAGIIILGGPGEETVAKNIASGMKQPSVCLAGRISLNELAYVISRLDLLVTNDSGPMHIGAAVETNMVTIFGPGNPVFFHPYTSQEKYMAVYSDIECRPCDKVECARGDVACLNNIPVSSVTNAATRMLPRAGNT